MQELLEWMEYIEDTRQQTKVRHTLKDILVIVLFATLANADDWVEMALFAESYQDYLRKYIELKNGIPSHDTIRRVMGMISPEILQQLYGKWQERLDKNDGELLKKIICIDGKTMCSNKRGEEKASHIVSAWSKEDGFCLGQKAVKEKSNEITAIPELLEKIQIKGQIITIDAMGTQTAIAGKIRQKRADYVLALKKNQYTMYEDVKEYFSNEEFQKEMREKGAYKKTREKAHGQIEIREYYQTEDIRWLSQKKNWKGLRSIVMEKKRIEKAGKITYEYRYFISSLKTDINEVSRAVRGHWSIESMHWHLDVTFREDANTTIDKMAAQNLNIIRKWSLSILKPAELSRHKLSMRKKRFVVSLRPIKYLEELLESDEDYKDKRIMTLGRLYDERQNQMETLYIPVLGEKDKEPEVTGFYVLRNGKAKERVSSELAMESMLLQGKLKGFSYQDAAGCEWRITKIHPSYEFEKNIEHPIIKIHLACTASLENATLTDWKHEETLERTLEEELQNRLNTDAKAALEKGIDISNSYKKLGNSYRKGYVYYEERREEYEKNLQIKVETEVSVVNLK